MSSEIMIVCLHRHIAVQLFLTCRKTTSVWCFTT